jgi:N-methylhydantoinase A/oxoprolinase/acetone carboxylase beta subunit
MDPLIVIGVDTGGTFTDFVCVEAGRLRIHKVPSTPADPAEAVLRGVGELLAGRAVGAGVVLYGTTVATNALIQRKGAATALVTTAGFEDVLEIGRQVRGRIYDMNVTAPAPIVGRRLRVGVRERTAADGTVLTALAAATVSGIAARLKRRGVRSVAVCFINSYANPANELAAKKLLRRCFDDVHTSFDVLPEYREYERFSTTCANAYVAPLLREHVERLGAELGGPKLLVMQSNGGLASAAHAAGNAVHSILSGPAAGVLGAFGEARQAGLSRFITFDMGGTSTDVSLCDGRIGFRSDAVVGGCPIRTAIVDVHTVGAGGGSVAWMDRGGALRVGPQSAGADPGPACYGKGGQFTVTDANLLLGRLQSDYFLGGRMRLYPELARRAASVLSRRLRLGARSGASGAVEKTSEAVLDVANATMIRAIRVVSVERGHDPADFALVAFGGAAPLHAVELAREMSIKRVLVPVDPGVLCARGLLTAPIMRDFSRTVLSREARPSGAAGQARGRGDESGRTGREWDESAGAELEFKRMEKLARAYFAAEGVRAGDAVLQRYVDVRYVGQSYEITVPFSRDFRDAFHAWHEQLYGHSSPDRDTEVVNVRVRAIGRIAHPVWAGTRGRRSPAESGPPRGHGAARGVHARSRSTHGASPRPALRVKVYASGRFRTVPLYERSDLMPGARVAGPALVVEGSSTTYLPGDSRCLVDARGNLILET